MSEGSGISTSREEPDEAAPPQRLTLEWVWPTPRRVPLLGPQLVIGRDAVAAIQIEGSGVSRQHAELNRQGPLCVLRDLGSTNGTWLDGRRIEHAPVAAGATLRIGDWVGVFALRAEGAAPFAQLGPELFGGPELSQVVDQLGRVARVDVATVLVGPTGSGRRSLARELHRRSGRVGAFVTVRCAAPAFDWPAQASEPGATLYLEQVQELSTSGQLELLAKLESAPDVRLTAASDRPLVELHGENRLHPELHAALLGLELRLPALAQRRADIAPLFLRFLERSAGDRLPALEARLLEALCLHDFPMHVQELELLARTLLAVHAHGGKLSRADLPASMLARFEPDAPQGSVAATTAAAESGRPLLIGVRDRRNYDLARVQQQLAANGGNIKAAAEALGISRQRIYRLLEQRGAVDEEVGGDSGRGTGH